MSRCPKCEKLARQQAREEREAGQRVGKPDRNGRVVHFSEAEIERRRQLAKQLHAQGRFGGKSIGARGGQAVNRHRIADAVLDYFRQPDKQELVLKAIESNLKGKNKPARLAAVRELRAMEDGQDDRLRADRGGAADPSGKTQEQLTEFVMQGLQRMIERGEFPVDIELGGDAVQEIP